MKAFYNGSLLQFVVQGLARASIVVNIEWVQFVWQNCEKTKKKNNSVRSMYDKQRAPDSTG